MRKLSTTEKSRMTTTQIESLNDSCVIHTLSGTQDSFGEVISSSTDSSAISCGIDVLKSNKKFNGEIVKLEYDAILRLPLTQAITINNEVTVRSIRYKVYGISTGNGVKVIPLKLVSLND